jgi:tRNA-Thr(GGU) m(6)t(6)A37 methyltransferase TsaA
MEVHPIGIIRSPHKTKAECPIQPAFAEGAEGRVEVFEEYAAGLKDIEGFSHIYLLYLLDRAGEMELVRPTFLDDTPHGVFASRHPCRPNGIGLSIVRLLRREDDALIVNGVDVLDGTPLLDIKPYVPKFDRIQDATEGWTAHKEWRQKPSKRE